MARSQAILVYLVDDQRTVRELLKAILQLEFEVEAFATGEEIISACRENPPDVVLSDLVMPEMGGIEVLKSLKSTVKTKNVPVMVLTAQTDITKLEEALAEGAHDYITKPCESTELRARIRGAFSLHEAQRELAKANQELEATYRVIKREMEAIGTLQRVLLPKSETIEDEFHIVNSYYKPCMDSGGDFFDIVRIDENRCVFAFWYHRLTGKLSQLETDMGYP